MDELNGGAPQRDFVAGEGLVFELLHDGFSQPVGVRDFGSGKDFLGAGQVLFGAAKQPGPRGAEFVVGGKPGFRPHLAKLNGDFPAFVTRRAAHGGDYAGSAGACNLFLSC